MFQHIGNRRPRNMGGASSKYSSGAFPYFFIFKKFTVKSDYLDKILDTSIVRDFTRGKRRYFPLVNSEGIQYTEQIGDWLKDTFKIIFPNSKPEEGSLAYAFIFYHFDKYVEEIEGKLWVRTIYKVAPN